MPLLYSVRRYPLSISIVIWLGVYCVVNGWNSISKWWYLIAGLGLLLIRLGRSPQKNISLPILRSLPGGTNIPYDKARLTREPLFQVNIYPRTAVNTPSLVKYLSPEPTNTSWLPYWNGGSKPQAPISNSSRVARSWLKHSIVEIVIIRLAFGGMTRVSWGHAFHFSTKKIWLLTPNQNPISFSWSQGGTSQARNSMLV